MNLQQTWREVGSSAAGMLRGLIKDNDKWPLGANLSLLVRALSQQQKHLTNVHFFPLAGGPVISMHVTMNTLIYSMAGIPWGLPFYKIPQSYSFRKMSS